MDFVLLQQSTVFVATNEPCWMRFLQINSPCFNKIMLMIFETMKIYIQHAQLISIKKYTKKSNI